MLGLGGREGEGEELRERSRWEILKERRETVSEGKRSGEEEGKETKGT